MNCDYTYALENGMISFHCIQRTFVSLKSYFFGIRGTDEYCYYFKNVWSKTSR